MSIIEVCAVLRTLLTHRPAPRAPRAPGRHRTSLVLSPLVSALLNQDNRKDNAGSYNAHNNKLQGPQASSLSLTVDVENDSRTHNGLGADIADENQKGGTDARRPNRLELQLTARPVNALWPCPAAAAIPAPSTAQNK